MNVKMSSKRLKHKIFFHILFIFALLMTSLMNPSASLAQSKHSQLQCRKKAKEASKTAFDQCMIAAKENEVEEIRQEFKVKVAKLKEQYEKKLKRAVAKIKKDSKNRNTPASGLMDQTNKQNKGNSTSLPPKVKTNASSNNDSQETSYTPPAPVNTQLSTNPDNDNTIHSINSDQSYDSRSSFSETSNDEPTIQLKEAFPSSIPSSPPPSSPFENPSSTTSTNPSYPGESLEGDPLPVY